MPPAAAAAGAGAAAEQLLALRLLHACWNGLHHAESSIYAGRQAQSAAATHPAELQQISAALVAGSQIALYDDLLCSSLLLSCENIHQADVNDCYRQGCLSVAAVAAT